VGGGDAALMCSNFMSATTAGSTQFFEIQYIYNVSGDEKLGVAHAMDQEAAGAAAIPSRDEMSHKWDCTCNPIDTIQLLNSGGTFTSGEMVVLGWDICDTHGTACNFWEQLASIGPTSCTQANLDTGTITAKKYLKVESYTTSSCGNNDNLYRFNNDSCMNYSLRHRVDNGTETTLMCQTTAGFQHAVSTPRFSTIFIINVSAQEKLMMGDASYQSTAGECATTSREEFAGKWTNTSAQITDIQLETSTGCFAAGSYLTVWGSN